MLFTKKQFFLSSLTFLFTFFLVAEDKVREAPIKTLHSEEIEYFKDVVIGNNRLAFELYQILKLQTGNFCFSPLEVITTLAVPAEGARGEMTEKLRKTLGYSLSLLPLLRDLNDFVESPNSKMKDGTQVLSTNACWFQKNLTLLPSFKLTMARKFRLPLNGVDFANELPQSINQINQWSLQQSQGKIKQLVNALDVTATTRLILTSGFSMRGGWSYPFDLRRTTRQPFLLAEHRTISVEMMHTTLDCPFWRGEKWEIISLPFLPGEQGAQLSLLIILPKDTSLIDLEKELISKNWDQWQSELKQESVSVAIPRFRVEKHLDLNHSLKALGLSLLFSPEADFSGMTNEKSLFINKFIQKSLIRIDENGADMPSTAISQNKSAPVNKKEETINFFLVSRPFVFAVIEQKTGSILLMGRLTFP